MERFNYMTSYRASWVNKVGKLWNVDKRDKCWKRLGQLGNIWLAYQYYCLNPYNHHTTFIIAHKAHYGLNTAIRVHTTISVSQKSQFCHLGSILLARQQRDASFFIMSIIRFAVTQETPELRIFCKNQDLFFIRGYSLMYVWCCHT
jgi:hypothetical protein